ncbi:MAG: hypothetical protein GY794_09210 [bacterium]|nr:hypothetical protein [bacterium]
MLDTFMITTPTVLVLGAGASRAFKYPTGPELVYAMLDGIHAHADLLQNELGISHPLLEKFHATLSASGRSTIDDFLARQPDFVDLARTLIALALVKHEKTELLSHRDTDKENWYKQYLLPAMSTPSLDDFGDNQLSVVTYNYDRSLEQFLLQSLIASYPTNGHPGACWEQIDKIPIIHLHGQLSDLRERPYSPTLNYSTLSQSAAHIRIIHEDIANDPPFQEARQLLAAAQRIYFLGFGYNDVNLRRLHIAELPIRNPDILGTTQGIGPIELQNLKTRTLNQIGFVNTGIVNFFRANAPLT